MFFEFFTARKSYTDGFLSFSLRGRRRRANATKFSKRKRLLRRHVTRCTRVSSSSVPVTGSRANETYFAVTYAAYVYI